MNVEIVSLQKNIELHYAELKESIGNKITDKTRKENILKTINDQEAEAYKVLKDFIALHHRFQHIEREQKNNNNNVREGLKKLGI